MGEILAELEGNLQGRDDAVGDIGGVVDAVEVFAQHDELVAAEPGDGVGLANARPRCGPPPR